MFWNRRRNELIAAYQLEIDHGIETAQSPLLQLGRSSRLVENLSAFNALLDFVQQRKDIAEPYVAVGGGDASWLFLLWLGRKRTATRTPELKIVYTGADSAATAASIALLQAPEKSRIRHAQQVAPSLLSDLFAAAPRQTSSIASDAFPLQVIAQTLPRNAASFFGEQSRSHENGEEQDMLAWLAVALTVVLFVIGLLV
jgi:hypothetical protein